MRVLIRTIMIFVLVITWQMGVIAEAKKLEENKVKVAILDSGCNIDYKEGISLIDCTVRDYNGHGTLMARIIKEEAPSAELYIVKVMDKDGLCPSEEAVIRGIEWAVSRRVDLINMSLRLRDSERLYAAITKAYNKGIIIFAAAGNKGSRIAVLTNQGALDLKEVAYPAKYDEVIAVGAVNQYGRVYDSSIQGKEVELICRGYRGTYKGTSIASAYATGIAASLLSKNHSANSTSKTAAERAKKLRELIHFKLSPSRTRLILQNN
jgi:subtilisin